MYKKFTILLSKCVFLVCRCNWLEFLNSAEVHEVCRTMHFVVELLRIGQHQLIVHAR